MITISRRLSGLKSPHYIVCQFGSSSSPVRCSAIRYLYPLCLMLWYILVDLKLSAMRYTAGWIVAVHSGYWLPQLVYETRSGVLRTVYKQHKKNKNPLCCRCHRTRCDLKQKSLSKKHLQTKDFQPQTDITSIECYLSTLIALHLSGNLRRVEDTSIPTRKRMTKFYRSIIQTRNDISVLRRFFYHAKQSEGVGECGRVV